MGVPVKAAPPELNTITGCCNFSDPAIVSVTISSVFACVLGTLSDVILIEFSVGAVLSNVTLPLPLVISVPLLFPARSTKSIA